MPTRIALLVMGVHRSGTSALTRVLSLLGAGLPNELLGPARGNERGHWESKRLVKLDDEIMHAIGEDWWDPAPIRTNWFGGKQAKAFASRIAGVIDAEYGDAPMIVIKDPRICRLTPLYFAALAQLDIAPRTILPLRFPGEVVSSIHRRDEIDPRIAEMLWLRHILEAEGHSRAFPRVWTGFGELLGDWRKTVGRIATTLDLEWPRGPDDSAAEIGSTLAPDLRHFDRDSAAPVGRLAQRVWDAAQRGLANDEVGLRAEFDAVRMVVDEIDRLAVPRVESAAAALEALRVTNAAATAAQAAASAQLEQLQAESGRKLADLQALSLAQAQLLAARDSEVEALRADVATLRTRIEGLEASTSWRVTAPLRKAAKLIGRPD